MYNKHHSPIRNSWCTKITRSFAARSISRSLQYDNIYDDYDDYDHIDDNVNGNANRSMSNTESSICPSHNSALSEQEEEHQRSMDHQSSYSHDGNDDVSSFFPQMVDSTIKSIEINEVNVERSTNQHRTIGIQRSPWSQCVANQSDVAFNSNSEVLGAQPTPWMSAPKKTSQLQNFEFCIDVNKTTLPSNSFDNKVIESSVDCSDSVISDISMESIHKK